MLNLLFLQGVCQNTFLCFCYIMQWPFSTLQRKKMLEIMAELAFKNSWTNKIFILNRFHIAELRIWQQTLQIMSNIEDTEFN